MDLPVFWQDDLEHLPPEKLAQLAFAFQSYILVQTDIIGAQADLIDELKSQIEILKGMM
jgi:hypothetical protein